MYEITTHKTIGGPCVVVIYMFSSALELYYIYCIRSNKRIYLDIHGNETICPTHKVLWDALNENEIPAHIKQVIEDVLG